MRCVDLVLIAHLADTHLGKQQYKLEFRENDVYTLFSEAFEYCIRERVKMIFISGDLFDEPRPRINALKTVLDVFRKAVSHDIKIVIIPGDHDVPKRRDRLIIDILPDIVDGVYSLGYVVNDKPIVKKVYNGLKLAVYALPFIPYRSIARNIIPRFLDEARLFFREYSSYRTVFLAHYSLKEYLPYDALLSITQLPPVNYAALGHIHDRIKQYIPGGGVLAYPGSIDIFNVNEALSWREKGKGFNIVDLSRKELSLDSIHWINLDIRPQHVIEVNDVTEELDEKVKGLLFNAEKKPIIVHVKVNVLENLVDRVKSKINRIALKYGKDVYMRLYLEIKEHCKENTTISLDSEDRFDETTIVSTILRTNSEVAKNIVLLAEKLSQGEYTLENILEILEFLYNNWFKALEEDKSIWKTSKQAGSRIKTVDDTRKRPISLKSRRSLLDYIS